MFWPGLKGRIALIFSSYFSRFLSSFRLCDSIFYRFVEVSFFLLS